MNHMHVTDEPFDLGLVAENSPDEPLAYSPEPKCCCVRSMVLDGVEYEVKAPTSAGCRIHGHINAEARWVPQFKLGASSREKAQRTRTK